jgi:beta-lactamase class A
LTDEQVTRLGDVPHLAPFDHRIAEVQDHLGSSVRANGFRLARTTGLYEPQPIDEISQAAMCRTSNVGHRAFTIIRRMRTSIDVVLRCVVACGVCVAVFAMLARLESRGAEPPMAAGSLQQLLEGDLARIPAKSGIYVKHLTTGDEAAVHGDEVFNSASVIKIPIMVLAYELAERGAVTLDARVTVQKRDLRGGSGVLRYHDIGLQPTVRDLITQMIITSDNTATDLMIAQVGGVAAVNAWLDKNGYRDLRLSTTIYEVFKRRYSFADPALASLTPEELYALQTGDASFAAMPRERFEAIQKTMQRPGLSAELNRQVNEEPATWLGQITPRGVGRLLEAIERCTMLTKASCAEMTRAFRRQQSGSRRLPHFVDVPVGHKTGDFPPALANDVGVIYARSGPIVVSFLTNAIREPYGELEDRMGRTARLIVDYFDGGR